MENLGVKSATIDNVKKVTKQDILRETEAIWREFNSLVVLSQGSVNCETFWDKIYKEHRDLCSSYPMVIKHMIYDRMYHSGAMLRYLTKVEHKPWTTDAERMDSYSEYFAILSKTLSPNLSKQAINDIKAKYRADLQKEHDSFMEEAKRVQQEVNQDVESNLEKRRQALIDRLIAQAQKSGEIDSTCPICKNCHKFVKNVTTRLGQAPTYYHCKECNTDICDNCFNPFDSPKCGHNVSCYSPVKL